MHIESYVFKIVFICHINGFFFVFQRTSNALQERLLNDLAEGERENLMELARRDLLRKHFQKYAHLLDQDESSEGDDDEYQRTCKNFEILC